jgi:formyl-CoA transferase
MSTKEKPMPLQGVRVIELGGLIAGPYAASLFAQFGAEVIKVEAPGEGDPLRRWRKLHNGTSLWWYSLSRNKQSITLNLKTEKGRRIVRSLAEKADVVIENFRPGVLEGWGLGWNDLSAINPGLVLVRITATSPASRPSPKPSAACATSWAIRIARRCARASAWATRSRRFTPS